ncbi:MAG: hypothetical protein WCK11_05430 [Candidatus Falkowbacteria bacterium]
MNIERWSEIVGQIKDNFTIDEEKEFDLDEEDGPGVCRYVVFKGPLGLMKLELIERPVILDKKAAFSNRIGSTTQVNYIYSDSEKTHKLYAFKWDEVAGDWQEIEAKNFA